MAQSNIERLVELAEGWECAALAEQGVLAKFQEAMEQFDAGQRSHGLLRHVRVYLDARSNRERFEKDAAAIRWAISLIPETSDAPVAVASATCRPQVHTR